MSVFVLGALHWDVVVSAQRLPRLGETLPGRGVDYRFGGKGGNQAVAAARMGARVAMGGRVGRDAAGRDILAALDAAGVDRREVRETSQATGMSVAITEEGGDYGAVIVPAANLENDGAVEVGEGLRVCVLQGEVPEAANLAIAARLPPEARLILNAAPARPVTEALLARTDVLVVNAVEATDLSGTSDPAAAARALAAEGPGVVIVTLGAEGALVLEAGTVSMQPAHAVSVVSAHGAGDMFVGALAAELARGAPMKAAVPFAQAAAALFVSRPVEEREKLTETLVRAFLGR